MDDSDEYFDDSLVLDEAALASIQATEECFGASLYSSHSLPAPPQLQAPPSPPPSKRLKTFHDSMEHGVTRALPQPVLRRLESLDLNPEVRVGPDGNYVVSTQPKAPNHAARDGGDADGLVGPPLARLDRIVSGGGSLVSEVRPSHIGGDTSKTPVIPAEVRPATQRFSHLYGQHNPPPQFRPTLSREPSRHQTLLHKQSVDQRTSPVIKFPDESIPSTASQRRARLIEQALAEVSAQPQLPPSVAPGQDVVHYDSPDIRAELASVRAQLEEVGNSLSVIAIDLLRQDKVNAENAAIQKSLREAQDAQLVKAGEVSILRQTIDKTHKEHAEAIAKAKADMIAHEKVKAELQAKLKEETERMATRLVFQQLEMETSTRKPMWGSVRSHHIAKDPLMRSSAFVTTPTRSRGLYPPASTSHPVRRTTLRKSHKDQPGGDSGPASSPTSECKTTRHGEDVKQPRFKGFHNAFVDSEPVMVQSPVKAKGGNAEENQGSDPFLTPTKANDSRNVGNRKGKGKEIDGEVQFDWWEEGDAHCREIGDPGVESMMVIDQEEGGAFLPQLGGRLNEEDMVIAEGVDWGEELRRIVFTHVAPRNDTLTLHLLFSTIIPPENLAREKHAYRAACQVILETCGARHGHTQGPDDSEWEATVVYKVANAFVIVGGILGRTGCIAPLTALLDLLLLLTLYIPAFLSPFLGPAAANTVTGQSNLDSQPQLLSMLCDIVRDHLLPPKANLNVTDNINGKENMRATLAMAVVQLMQSLCWRVKDSLVDQLGVLPRQPQVFEILLDPAQAPELVARTLQLLVLLATHRDPLQISLVEKLCYYLVEPAVETSYQIRHLVVTLIGLLADSHIEARTVLLESVSLVPSLVICIAKLSRLLWEDDIAIMNTPELAKLTVDLLYSSVNLLHHLVFVLDLSTVLGRKLVEATRLPGPFNGVTHMFIVTFGRLSWAEGPDWLEEECKDKCDVIAELAMDIIETVVAGPECDSLWAVWHQPEVTDEEEFEAWKNQID